jgi:CRISPR-associated endonuclease/helicase Cas3
MQPAADDSPDLYWNVACERADQACRKIGLLAEPLSFQATGSPLLARLFPAIFPHFPPSPLQRAASTMPLPAPGRRILIESETGSGKTEASLTLYARLRAEGLVGGLFFALPTRATAAAISDRVAHFLGCAYADVGAPTSALAVGGQAQRTEGFGFPGVDPDLYPDADDRELRAWASSSSKKYLTAEIVVGTLDQLLLGGLPVRHAHLRLAAATRHLLVVDELHSYDRYMGEILSRVLDLHSCAGGVSVLMSATLSEKERLRYALVDEPPRSSTARTASEAEYPMLAEAVPHGADPWRAHELASEPSRFGKELRWSMIDESDLVGIAASAAVDGARVCVLRNTVTGARTSLDALAADSVAGDHLWHPYPARGPDRPAYHSRYTRADRAALDAAVLRDFGRTGAASGTILVATQVVEQSLDVDFDLMISDLPPVDALLQRVGRLHRHPERVRPLGHVDAQTYVIGPADATFTEWLNQKKERGENGWGTVYEDLVDLELTVGVIRDHPEIKIPEQNRLLIELVYHPEHRDRLADSSSRWEEYARRANSRALGQEINARQVALEFTTETYTTSVGRFEEAQEQRIRTRLGDDQVRIELPRPVPGHYGDGLAYFVELPIRIVSRVDDDSPTTLVCTAIEAKPAHYLLGETVIWYDAQGWHW